MRKVRGMLVLSACCGLALLPSITTGADKSTPAALDLSKLPPAAATQVDFTRDIKPILVDNCISCHGPKKHEGGLRLNTNEAALAGGDNGPVLMKGKSIDSRLIHIVGG